MCWNFAGNLRTQQSCYSRHCGMPVTCDNEARAVLLPANPTILLLSALRNARGSAAIAEIYVWDLVGKMYWDFFITFWREDCTLGSGNEV